MSKSRVFAAELLKLLRELPPQQHEAAAKVAGFHREEQERSGAAGSSLEMTLNAQQQPGKASGSASVPSALSGQDSGQVFWRVASDLTDPESSDRVAEQSVAPDWLQEPAQFDEALFVSAPVIEGLNSPPPATPLVSPERFAGFVSAHLRPRLYGAEPDVPRTVNRLAAARPLQPWPRAVRRQWPGQLTVVLDASQVLTPFRDDLLHLLGQLRRLLQQRLRLVCTQHGEPDRWISADHLADTVPTDGSPVVVLGDAGCYRQHAGLHERWVRFAQTLACGGVRPLLLAPVPQRLVPDGVREAFDVVLLDQGAPRRLLACRSAGTGLSEPQPARHREGLGLLRAALFGNSHVRWSLVRRLRRVLQETIRHAGLAEELAADIGTEAELWQDAGVCVTSTACALAADQVELACQQLQTWQVRQPVLLAELVRCHLEALAPASPLVRALYVSEVAGAHLLPDSDISPQRDEASDLLAHAARCLHHRPDTETARRLQGPLRDFMAGLSLRSPGAVGRGDEALQTAWALARMDDLRQGRAELPDGLRLDQLAWLVPNQSAPDRPACLHIAADPARSKPGAPAFRLEMLPEDDTHPCPAALVSGIQGTAYASVVPVNKDVTASARLLNFETSLPLEHHQSYRVQIGRRQWLIESFQKPSWVEAIQFSQGDWLADLSDGRSLTWIPRQTAHILDADSEIPSVSQKKSTPRFELPHAAWCDLGLNAHTKGSKLPSLLSNRPAWAARHGVDEYGYWAEFEVDAQRGSVVQRMRWIAPGEFLMGSQKNEKSRSGNECQHKVILTQGYWLAETTCTQALWQAVTGENPSSFKDDPQNPVEKVSWEDVVEKFLPKLNKRVPGLMVELPTEAKWEYACRAGTQTPFWFGEQITTEQVNYDGNNPYAGGRKGEYRQKTVSVKALPANGWGLYQMHGNVWEWCADWLGEYPRGEVMDPKGPEESQEEGSRQRVLRGGGWFVNGGFCRSAGRRAARPDVRYYLFGFRLAQ